MEQPTRGRSTWLERLPHWTEGLASIGASPDDTEDERLQKASLVLTVIAIVVLAVVGDEFAILTCPGRDAAFVEGGDGGGGGHRVGKGETELPGLRRADSAAVTGTECSWQASRSWRLASWAQFHIGENGDR